MILSLPPGTTVLARSADMAPTELVALISKTVGVPMSYEEVSDEAVRKAIGEPLADEIGDSMGYWNDFGYAGGDTEVKEPEEVS